MTIPPTEVPARQVRAAFTESTITVYQAYAPAIAEPAVAAGRFVPPFRRGRMTWVKPSFLWMMYRCGWATKPDQERVLAVELTRAGFEWALANARLSDETGIGNTPVRVQWDPERDLRLRPLAHRSLQLGLAGTASDRYVDEWTVAITDVTPTVRAIRALLDEGDEAGAAAALPMERPYPLPPEAAAAIGASAT